MDSMSRGHKIRTACCEGEIALEAGLSTGEAARLLSVEPDTVLKWIKRGKLQATRTPGGHHRIPAASVDRLLGRPAAGSMRCWQFFGGAGTAPGRCQDCAYYRSLNGEGLRVMAVSPSRAIVRRGEDGIRVARDAYEASALIEEWRPDIAVLDEDLPAPGWRRLAERLAADPRVDGIRLFLAAARPQKGKARPPLSGRVLKPFRLADLPSPS